MTTPTSRRCAYALSTLFGLPDTPAATAVWVSSTDSAAIARSESTKRQAIRPDVHRSNCGRIGALGGSHILTGVRLVPRSFPGRLAAVVAVGVVLRAIYLFTIARHVVGIGDWWFYHWQAQSIAQGHGFIEPWVLLGTGQYRPSAIHPPLYPLVLSGFYKLGLHSTLAQRSLGLGFGAITMVLVGLLGRRVGGAKLGLLAAGVYAVYPVMIAADGNLMSETLYGALIAGMLLAAVAVLDRPTWRRAALLGALIALAALTRTEALFFLPFLVLPVAWRAQPTWRGRGGLVLAAGLGCVVVLAPWTIRNENVFGRFVLISTNDATVIAGANCDRPITARTSAAGTSPARRRSRRRTRPPRRRSGASRGSTTPRTISPVCRSSWLMRELRVWDLWQPRRQAKAFSEGVQTDVAQLGVAAYYALMLLAIPGLLLLRRRARPLLLVLLSPAARRDRLDSDRVRRAPPAVFVRDPADGARGGGDRQHPGAARSATPQQQPLAPPLLRARGRMTRLGWRRALIAIALGGLVLRVIYAYVIVRSKSLNGDALEFQLQANLLADGHGYIQPFTWQLAHIARPTADKPPVYPSLEALISLFGGRSWGWHDLVDILAGTATIVVTGLLGRRVGGERLGLIAAGLAAVYPLLIAADGSLRSESVFALLVTLALLQALRLRETPSVEERRAPRRDHRARDAHPLRGAAARRPAAVRPCRPAPWPRDRRGVRARAAAVVRALLDRVRSAGAALDERRRAAGGGELRPDVLRRADRPMDLQLHPAAEVDERGAGARTNCATSACATRAITPAACRS